MRVNGIDIQALKLYTGRSLLPKQNYYFSIKKKNFKRQIEQMLYFKCFYIQNKALVQVKADGSVYTLLISLKIMWTYHFTSVLTWSVNKDWIRRPVLKTEQKWHKAKQVRGSRLKTHTQTHTVAQAFPVFLYGLGAQPERHTQKKIVFQLPYLKWQCSAVTHLPVDPNSLFPLQ